MVRKIVAWPKWPFVYNTNYERKSAKPEAVANAYSVGKGISQKTLEKALLRGAKQEQIPYTAKETYKNQMPRFGWTWKTTVNTGRKWAAAVSKATKRK